MSEQNNHPTQKENKKLKSKIEDLELISVLRMEIIYGLVKLVGDEAAKKLYPKKLIEDLRNMSR